jgi:hypothetical protein
LAQSDETTNKLVGMLIQVLHGEYSDTRDLAVVQLVLLGNKSVKPLLTYLEKEEHMQTELESEPIRNGRLADDPPNHESWVVFYKKWGHLPDDYEAGKMAEARMQGIQGALKTLSILGIDDATGRFSKLAEKLQGKESHNIDWP